MKWHVTDNSGGCIKLSEIPVGGYGGFYSEMVSILGEPHNHIADYFACPAGDELLFICIMLDDVSGKILIGAHKYDLHEDRGLESIATLHPQIHPFERGIAELYGVRFVNSPWDKPLRFPHNRHRLSDTVHNYPFYTIDSDLLHEVNVGPVHAGIIEPGAFRFICNGEKILHLEIALGYQHRGVETLMTSTRNMLRQTVLTENIAGDSAVSHAAAFAAVAERLSGHAPYGRRLDAERAVAMELERIAMHIADSGALCADIGYQTGQVACEALRTIVINTTLQWCGNRFGKGLVRPCGTHYPLDEKVAGIIMDNLAEVERRYGEIHEDLKSSQSLLARFEDCGEVGATQMLKTGAVGQAARSSGLRRDIRATHPWGAYRGIIDHNPILREQGDVMARLMLRGREILQSIGYVKILLGSDAMCGPVLPKPEYGCKFEASSLAFSLVEGWRGEICHTALTDPEGNMSCYKIKDPSLHNWMALALAVRGEGISDFPICNKSFNLSYCGHDL